MDSVLLTVAVRTEDEVVAARQRARQIAEQIGFDRQDQVRIATAVSEIARNAFRYAGGGRVEFSLRRETPVQELVIRILDNGPGIADVHAILAGHYQSSTGMGMGITGSKRLMDRLHINSSPGKGTVVEMVRVLPSQAPPLDVRRIAQITEVLARRPPRPSLDELGQQNQELLRTLAELQAEQQKLALANEELHRLNEQIQAATRHKSEFLANMSHEIRTPLNAIIGFAELMHDGRVGPIAAKHKEYLGDILQSAWHLLGLINDILDLAKVEAGKMEFFPEVLDLDRLVAQVLASLRGEAMRKQIDIEADIDPELGRVVLDPAKLKQVFYNLLSNALKFTPELGRVCVRLARMGEKQVRIEVEDSGVGIRAEDLPRLFLEFQQLPGTSEQRRQGTGLGLALTRRIVEAQGGTIQVHSVPGQGSNFTVVLPREMSRA